MRGRTRRRWSSSTCSAPRRRTSPSFSTPRSGPATSTSIVDLGERADASSDLLTVLHRCARRVRTLGGTLAVVCSRPELRRLFDVTLLSQGFGVYASRDEALRTWA